MSKVPPDKRYKDAIDAYALGFEEKPPAKRPYYVDARFIGLFPAHASDLIRRKLRELRESTTMIVAANVGASIEEEADRLIAAVKGKRAVARVGGADETDQESVARGERFSAPIASKKEKGSTYAVDLCGPLGAILTSVMGPSLDLTAINKRIRRLEQALHEPDVEESHVSDLVQELYSAVCTTIEEEFPSHEGSFYVALSPLFAPFTGSDIQECIVEIGFWERRLEETGRQPEEIRQREPHLIATLKSYGKLPEDFLRCRDDRIQVKWISEARRRVAHARQESSDVPASLQFPDFMKWEPARWVALMAELGLDYDADRGKYRWPLDWRWWEARLLLDTLISRRAIDNHLRGSYGVTFQGLFWSAKTSDVGRLNGVLTKSENQPSVKRKSDKKSIRHRIAEIENAVDRVKATIKRS